MKEHFIAGFIKEAVRLEELPQTPPEHFFHGFINEVEKCAQEVHSDAGREGAAAKRIAQATQPQKVRPPILEIMKKKPEAEYSQTPEKGKKD